MEHEWQRKGVAIDGGVAIKQLGNNTLHYGNNANSISEPKHCIILHQLQKL